MIPLEAIIAITSTVIGTVLGWGLNCLSNEGILGSDPTVGNVASTLH